MSIVDRLPAEQAHLYLHDPFFHALVHVIAEILATERLTRQQVDHAIQVAEVRSHMIRYDRGERA